MFIYEGIKTEEVMRSISLSNARPGMILGKDIYTSEGTILLSKGIKLTEYFIIRLNQMGFLDLYIDDDITKDIEIVDIINEKTRIMAKGALMEAMNAVKMKKELDVKKIKMLVNSIIDEILSSKNIMISLSDLRTVDEYTFGHSVNVAILSLVMGKALGLNELKLRDLGIGAILHDIGKTKIPNEILNKKGKLENEEIEIIKKHTTLGYEILKKYDDISSLSKGAVLFHHERIDGSGYPFGKKGKDIHLFGRIVAITDTFDAMTSNRIYKRKVSNGEALEFILSTGMTNYDYELVKIFMNHVTIYPLGTIVKLNNGEKAIVIDNNKDAPTRPIVRIISKDDSQRINGYEEIDLQKKLTIFIDEIYDE